MKLPARFIAGNLAWGHDASVWAVFRVDPVSYPWLPRHEKLRLHQQTRAALRTLTGDAMVLSVCTPLAAEELSRRMGAPGPAGQRLADLAARTARELRPTERHWFLSAELPAARSGQGVLPLVGSATAAVTPAFGLPPQKVTGGDVSRRQEQSRQLLARLRAFLPLTPATPAEVCWVYSSAVRRGLGAGGVVPHDPGLVVGRPRLTAIADAVFKEGGLAGDPDRPSHRRYLRVETEDGVAYQALLAMSEMPRQFLFPDGGGEWLVAADGASFPVDWCLRIRPVANRVAQATARRQARQLQSQVAEYDGDPAGAPPGLAEAMEALGDLRSQLSGDGGDAELQVTMIFAVAATGLRELEERVGALRSMYAASGYVLHRPIGGQTGLFMAMLPGAGLRAPAGDYRHHLLCRDLAAGMPFAAAAVGDPQGALLGYCTDAATFRPVLFDPAYGPGINRSGSLGAFGALGSGKSYFMKSVVYATLARGGRVAVLDRTAAGEYVRLAGVVPGRSEVIPLTEGSPVCLDPLRVFSGDDRIGVATAFLTLLTGAAPNDADGMALAEAVRSEAARPGGRLAAVIEALERAAPRDPAAEAACRGLRHALHHPLARFTLREAPLARLDADYLVLHAPGLSLPDREIALREHLARRLPPEQVLSQAVLYLMAAVARHVTFSDPRRFAAALFDEAWYLTSSLQGRALLLDGIRDGRKHNAAIWLVSQHPDDLGDDALTHLLGPRFVFRQAKAAAPAALHFLGIEASQRAVDTVVSAPEGTCLFRDVRDRVGRVHILPAMTSELHDAFDTNPLTGKIRPAGAEPA
ncbi:MAG TPA: ATP-binding protein [Actinomycetota bacterium]